MNPFDIVAAELVQEDDELHAALGAPDSVDAKWFADRWIGSGSYGRAYAVSWNGAEAVFKLTLDVDECNVAEATTETEGFIRGLVYVYMMAWLDNEFDWLDNEVSSGEGMPNCVIVTEKADTFLLDWRADAMAACMQYLDRIGWDEDDKDLWYGLTQNMTDRQRGIAARWLEDLRHGLHWIGDVPLPDTNDGNAGLVTRRGREMAVWVDFGQG